MKEKKKGREKKFSFNYKKIRNEENFYFYFFTLIIYLNERGMKGCNSLSLPFIPFKQNIGF